MKLGANEEYGLRCLVRIGYAGKGGSLTIPEMSHAEGVSPAYAAKILRVLRKGGFVKAERGKEGGYTLARPPDRLSSPTSLAPWAAASSRANSATTIPARPPSAPVPWIAPCVPSGAPCKSPSTRFSAKPLCATSAERRRDELLGAHHPRSEWVAVDSVKRRGTQFTVQVPRSCQPLCLRGPEATTQTLLCPFECRRRK